MGRDHPYTGFLEQVEKPSRYVGGEYRAHIKKQVRIRMCLAFPDLYEIGMSHLGTKILYSLLNQQEDIALERVFAPWFDMERELRKRNLPLLSLETNRQLTEFDVVGFSLQYELTYTNILTILDLSHIPFRTVDRDGSYPLIIAGGPSATNPEPIAPFMDAIVVGDGEEVLPLLLRCVADGKEEEVGRYQLLGTLARLPGVYVPSLYSTRLHSRTNRMVVGFTSNDKVPSRVKRVIVEDLDPYPFPSDSPEPWTEAIFDRISIEIARGCTQGCRFCQAGIIYRPMRERDPGQIVTTILNAVDDSGYDEASLTSLSTADYSCITPLVRRLMSELRPRHVSLSVSSLRAYGLDGELLDELSSVRETGLTFAPEAGSHRLRAVINKNVSDSQFHDTCHRVFSRGWKRIKLYFMIGLPTEEREDLLGILELARQALQIGRSYHGRVEVTVSLSSFVPKPHTPFQWCAMNELDEIRHKQRLIKEQLPSRHIRLRVHDPRMSQLEGIFSRCDRRGADLLEMAWQEGARFDGWDDHLNWEAWQWAFERWKEKTSHHPTIFLQELPVDEPLPWEHIDIGVEREFLLSEYERAKQGRITYPCAQPVESIEAFSDRNFAQSDSQRYVCYQCGMQCDLERIRKRRQKYARSMQSAPARRPEESTSDELRRAFIRFKQGLAPRSFDRGANLPFRIHYHKLRSAIFMGHLDLVRLIGRIFRRAGIEVCYSQGFHPKPVMSFGPALALGIRSIAEVLDVRLIREVQPDEMIGRLNHASPEGLRFVSARRLSDQERKLSKLVHAQEYLFTLPEEWFRNRRQGRDEVAVIEELCQEIMTADQWPISVMRKGRQRWLDLRESLLECSVILADQWDDALQFDASMGARVRIDMRTSSIIPQPREIAQAVFRTSIPYSRIARIGIWSLDSESKALPL